MFPSLLVVIVDVVVVAVVGTRSVPFALLSVSGAHRARDGR